MGLFENVFNISIIVTFLTGFVGSIGELIVQSISNAGYGQRIDVMFLLSLILVVWAVLSETIVRKNALINIYARPWTRYVGYGVKLITFLVFFVAQNYFEQLVRQALNVNSLSMGAFIVVVASAMVATIGAIVYFESLDRFPLSILSNKSGKNAK